MKTGLHIAIVMDGNGRWGKQRGLSRSEGHYAGSKAMEELIYSSVEIGIKVLTLYAFSTENWKRPKDEVNYLMDLPAIFLKEKLPTFMEKNIKVCVSGDINGLPVHTREAVASAISTTKNNDGLIVNFAMNYGGRAEILSAVKSLMKEIHSQNVQIEQINDEMIENYLYTHGLPDPDIIIRTGGEKRLSNFLVWQSAKAELWFTERYFPDFDKKMLQQAIVDVKERKYRFLQENVGL
ncbi:isoprenyl transferase [Cytobacillus purgationiresistens]|uniref:Isoprenyl transferase n=1 Tax=Cytobacillus purgationiresistens TaxID=863449 RepID=A0ABU0ALV9_9BACI|nr:isoprenyl transferase [Cytobacillus purgationiresistens]MDQ0271368.1 undecaprenyl diphosphate synthase [Cytobacillus purgationiresistens]